ncbi:AraC family transcriptional regulator [Burkholderia sp. WAC0059]|uniref:helix-turn-helix transcriptional regulator n=1 Tax=Burkholderia sp. WAC0059 TaxID=2066022 RepID=UPI000C7EBA00|nr:helix-turn-helix transcriptional regulator [Burkholderia sp. WAC0059]PLZ00046.1 AraC family transcriptional regulator [Burkholderia sp. WAC0059]
MFSTVYFAVVSTLSSSDVAQTLASKMLSGQWQDAVHAAARRADPELASAKPAYDDIQLYGDIQLVLGRHEEAEETFRKAQKAIRGSRDAIRVTSCRNTGWQAMFQHNFNVALSCFKRVLDDQDASLEQRLDSLVGITLVLHQLGCIESVCARLAELAALVGEARDERWTQLMLVLRRDLLTQYHLHCSERLADHVYWRSVVLDFLPRELGDIDAPAPACPDLPVLGERLAYLDNLRALAGGKTNVVEGIDQYVRWSAQLGLAEYRRTLCLEVALASIAAQAPAIGESMLKQCDSTMVQADQHARWYVDYIYCLAKVRQLQGRIQEFSQLYGRYAFASIRHVRADSALMPLTAAPVARASQPRSDDVSARLPGKYRRAYRYMMENLDQRDLSVREIASHIGVTERAIQAVFKNHLGLSPSQLIRRQRMERIHANLADDDAHVTSVLDVANRWGVQHRSTLINSYRKLYNEAPSETLAR